MGRRTGMRRFLPWSGRSSEDEVAASAKKIAAVGSPQSFVQQVMRAIYSKWRAQEQRALNYRRLFALAAFLALLLGVLYAQRDAATAYRVHSTISSVVAPSSSSFQSADAVYDWLGGVMQAVWQDPVCGDGFCDTPFEFPSYGRFGCRADCGNLVDLQHLSSIDIDLTFDFRHQPGSLPAAELMSQATWNLCPTAVAYDSQCYYEEDNPFSAVAGTLHVTLTDVPDGAWALRVKRDFMSKVAGAVRSTAGIAQAAAWYKVYIATAGVAAEQAYELGLLSTALDAARTPFLDYLPTLWTVNRATERDLFDAQQMRNATCMCGTGATSVLQGTAGFVDEVSYQTGPNCTGIHEYSRRFWSATGPPIVTTTSNPDATDCGEALANLTTHYNAFNATMLGWLVTQRLGNLATTGKIANRTATVATLRAFLAGHYPELVAPVFTTPQGTDALGDPAAATLASLVTLYVDAPSMVAGGPPAHLALFRRRLNQDPGMTITAWGNRAVARIVEIGAQQAEVADTALPVAGAAPASVGSVVGAFRAAGANGTWLPDPSATELGVWGVAYNLVSWTGGQYEFVSCALPRRGPEYVGTCQQQAVICAVSSVDGAPYTCTRRVDNNTVPGNLSSSAYRDACEAPCDMELDCGALCDCGINGCGEGEVCICQACKSLQSNAAADGEFMTIAAAAASSGAAAAVFAPMTTTAGGKRRLQAATNDDVIAQLAVVSAKVDALRVAQDSVGSQVDVLRGKVDQANLLAEARAANTRVQDLISAGRSDIAVGQRVLESKLDTLLQRQQAALDAARTASAALQAIQGLSERQVAALNGLDAAVKEQVRTISVATTQGLISLATALSYWKVARRNRAAEAKVYRLSNTPCSSAASLDYPFTIDNGNTPPNATARDRSVGLSNRVVGGMLLHVTRAGEEPCPPTRFSAIQPMCRASRGLDVSSFGIDPAFKPGTASFQPDLAAPDDSPMLSTYDCGGLSSPTYLVTEPVTGLTVNPAPYCAELYNPRNVPWGFHHFPLEGAPPGFPVWLDINLSQTGAQTWLTWLREGLLLDAATRSAMVEFVVYNADLRIFALTTVGFEFGAGGSIQVSYRTTPLRLELYDQTSRRDGVRFAAEIILTAAVGLMAVAQLWDIGRAAMQPSGLRRYFSSPAHVMDAASNALLVVCCALWWRFVTLHARVWTMNLRYDVYSELQPAANFLRLAGGGRGLLMAHAAIRGLAAAVQLAAWYWALSGISILLLLARLLRRMDFQPRLGVLTRSLRRALPDLLHFALVAGSVFVGYAMMAFLIFGASVPKFSGLGASLATCFSMMLGDFGDAADALGQLGGVAGVAGGFFFWTFMLLVTLVLLNFLLAIIVDAFSAVKEATAESTGLHTELATLAADRWRALTSLLPWGPTRASRRKLDALLHAWAGADAPRPSDGGDSALASGQEEPGGGGGAELAAGTTGSPILVVGGQLLDETDLARALAQALEPFDAVDGGGKGASGAEGVMGAEEAVVLARAVLQRYGSRRGVEAGLRDSQMAAAAGDSGGAAGLEAEKDRLAAALEQLAEAQRGLADAQHALMAGQQQLAEQQARLLGEER